MCPHPDHGTWPESDRRLLDSSDEEFLQILALSVTEAPSTGSLLAIDRIRSTFENAADKHARTKLAQAPMPSFPGYAVLEKLGSGAFGAVYRARDEQLGRDVALKVLLPGGAMDARARQRFLEEARALASVRHPNVLAIHSVLEANGRIGLVMELIEGQSFDEIIQESGPFSAGEASRVGAELCRALAAVHAAGLVHRDVKLSNILRERGGRIVLTDFGLGVFITRETESETRGLVAGSPLFMAPEQARGEDVDARTDLYALGVVLYHLTTNKYPVYSDRLPLLLDQIRAGALVSLRDARPDLPEAFTHLVMKALSRHPEARFQSAGEMEQALLSCLGTASTVSENRAALPMQGGRNRWRGLELILRLGRREFRLAIGVSLLLLVSTGLFLHWYDAPLSIDNIAMAPPEEHKGAPEVQAVGAAKGEASAEPVVGTNLDHAGIFSELTEIQEAYDSGQVTDLETLERLEEFAAKNEQPICGEQAGELMVHIVEVRTKDGKKALATLLAQEVSPLVAKQRYEEAASRLEEIRRRYPEITREVDEELARISAQARERGKDPVTSPPTKSKSPVCAKCSGKGTTPVTMKTRKIEVPCRACTESGKTPLKGNLLQKSTE